NTGSVTFKEGSTTLAGPIAVDAIGKASFAIATLTAGSHTITATYTDGTSFITRKGSMNQTDKAAPTNTAATTSLTPTTFGQSVTISATVTSSGSAVTTGSITFKEGATTLAGPTTVDATGKASFTTATLGAGSHTITATYNGVTNYSASSGTVTQTVSAADTTTAVTSSVNPSTFGQAVTLTATVTSSFATV